MLIDFSPLPEVTIPHLNGGEGAVSAKMVMEPEMKLMVSRLPAGASIGVHTHADGSEIDYVLSGTGLARCNGDDEPLSPGLCHYCPKGSCHEIINAGSQDLILLTIVPKQ